MARVVAEVELLHRAKPVQPDPETGEVEPEVESTGPVSDFCFYCGVATTAIDPDNERRRWCGCPKY